MVAWGVRRIGCIVLAAAGIALLVWALQTRGWWVGSGDTVRAKIGLRQFELCMALEDGWRCEVMGTDVTRLGGWTMALGVMAIGFVLLSALIGALAHVPAVTLAWLSVAACGAAAVAAVGAVLAGLPVKYGEVRLGWGMPLFVVGAAAGGAAGVLAARLARGRAPARGPDDVRAMLGLGPLAGVDMGPPCPRCAAPTRWHAEQWVCGRCAR